MHYCKWNISKYLSHTAHLDELEDLAYRRMLDWCYLHESPLPKDIKQISKLIRMRTHCERIADVLEEFFIAEEEGYFNAMVNQQLIEYRSKTDKAKSAAKARWDKKALKDKQLGTKEKGMQTHSERNADAIPNTKEEILNTKHLKDTVECLDYLNLVSGRKFKVSPEIKARFKDGYSVADIKLVIDYKCKDWMGKPEQKYIRPTTLFRPSNFEGYLNDAKANVPTGHSYNSQQNNQTRKLSAIERLDAEIERELRERQDPNTMVVDREDVPAPMGFGSRGESGLGESMGSHIEGDYTTAD